MEGTPVILFGVSLLLGWRLRDGAVIGLLTATGLLSALLFGVMLQVSERAMDWADRDPPPGADTSEHAIRLEELAANAAYSSLTSIAAAIVFTVALIVPDSGLGRWLTTAVGLSLGLHLVLVLMMVMKRVFALTQGRLDRARTGAGGDDLTQRRDSA